MTVFFKIPSFLPLPRVLRNYISQCPLSKKVGQWEAEVEDWGAGQERRWGTSLLSLWSRGFCKAAVVSPPCFQIIPLLCPSSSWVIHVALAQNSLVSGFR